jgi:shikimate dehydrogenase
MIVSDTTRIAGSLAGKQSKIGSVMHTAAYEAMHEDMIYIPFTVTDVKSAIAAIRALHFVGTAVSMPHKQEVMKYLDKIDPVAKEIGAVNTVLNRNGILTGYNSDWIGAMAALKEVCTIRNKKVALLGAGGAARAIAYGLKANKAVVTIYNRSEKKGKMLAKDFGHAYGGRPNQAKDYDILINATSVGFLDEKSIISSVKEGTIVMDVVFNRKETPLLKIARNCRHVYGYKMLIYQAIFQIELWTGKSPSFKVMETALLNALK